MLENLNWIAGIVVAIIAVLTYFRRNDKSRDATNTQNAKVSGRNNSVTQSSNVANDGERRGQ